MMSPKILSLHALALSSTVVLSLGMHSTPQQLRRNIVDTAALPKEDGMELERELSESELPWYKTEEIKLNQEPCMSMNVEVGHFIEDENTNLLTTEVPTASPVLQTLPPSTLLPSSSSVLQQTIPPSTDEPQTLPPSNENEDTNFLTTEVPTESPILQTLPPSTSTDVPDTLSPSSSSTQQTIPPSTDEPQTLPPSNSAPQTGTLPSTLVPQTSSPTTSTPLTTLYPTPFVSRVVFRIPIPMNVSIHIMIMFSTQSYSHNIRCLIFFSTEGGGQSG